VGNYSAVRVEGILALRRAGIGVALCVMLLPLHASAAPGASGGQIAPAENSGFALFPGFAPAISTVWLAMPASGTAPTYHFTAGTDEFNGDPNSPSFDIGGYNAMWDDMKFSEMSAYGGLARDTLRVAGMRAIDGSDGVSGAIPYGRLTLARDFLDAHQQLALGAYGAQVSVRQTAISGFGNDSYTDVALDGSWRFVAHPERSISDTITAHVMFLHEDESLLASNAIFGTRKSDNLSVFRGDLSWSGGGNFVPAVQYFHITGSSDPIRLGTLDGSPNSNGFITEIDYVPSDNARSPLNWFNVKLSLQFVSYSEFEGTAHDAAHNNTVLFHLTADTDPGS
jgi:hypothetical protein